jgi:hypothetical protein
MLHCAVESEQVRDQWMSLLDSCVVVCRHRFGGCLSSCLCVHVCVCVCLSVSVCAFVWLCEFVHVRARLRMSTCVLVGAHSLV